MNTKSVKFSDLTSALAALVLYRGSSRLLCTAINWISLHCTVFTCTGRCHRLIAHCTVLNYNTLEDAVCVWFAFQCSVLLLAYHHHLLLDNHHHHNQLADIFNILTSILSNNDWISIFLPSLLSCTLIQKLKTNTKECRSHGIFFRIEMNAWRDNIASSAL